MGKGAIEGTNARYTGMIGMHGTKASNFGVTRCDLLIVIGARFSDRVVVNPNSFARMQKLYILTLIQLKLIRMLRQMQAL